MMKERIAWVDNMKAVAIFLVVAGHYVNAQLARAYIYSFHVPLFFLVSGLLFSRKDPGSLKEVVTRRLRTLGIPYIIFETLRFVFFHLRREFGRTPEAGVGPWDRLYYIVTLKASWFLGVLFVVSIAYYLFSRRFKGFKSFLVLAAACTGAHYVLATWPQPYIHDNLPRCFTAMVFFALGAVLGKPMVSRTPISFVHKRLYIVPAVLAMNIIVFHYTYSAYGPGVLGIDFSRNYFSFYALSLSGIFLVYFACNHIPSNRIMRFVGANTILIYLMEAYPPAVVRRFMKIALNFDNTGSIDLAFACLYSAMTIAILTPVIMLINRYAPWAGGRRPSKRLPSAGGDPIA